MGVRYGIPVLLALLAMVLGPTSLGAAIEPLGVPEPSSTVGDPSPAAPSSDPPGDTARLPARIASGSCEQPGDILAELLSAVAGAPPDGMKETVYASVSATDMSLTDLTGQGRSLAVGGSDLAGAVACGSLDAPPQGPADLAIALTPMHESPYSGTALFRESDGKLTVYLVVVAAPQASAAPGSPMPELSTGPDASGLSPVRSAEPGTSGAAPFSPLPAGSSAP